MKYIALLLSSISCMNIYGMDRTQTSSLTPLMDLLDNKDIQEVKRRVMAGACVNEEKTMPSYENIIFYNQDGTRSIGYRKCSNANITKTLLCNLLTSTFNTQDIVELASMLIQQGADLNQPTGASEHTALHLIASKRIVSLIDIALAKKPIVDTRDKYLFTPLHLSVQEQDKSPVTSNLVEKLIIAGAQVNALTIADMTPLHFAARHEKESIASTKKIIQLLLQYGADPSIKDTRDKTPYDYATNGEIQAMLLIEK